MYFRGERLDWGNGLRDAACHGKVQGEYSVAAIYNSQRVSPISNKRGLGSESVLAGLTGTAWFYY